MFLNYSKHLYKYVKQISQFYTETKIYIQNMSSPPLQSMLPELTTQQIALIQQSYIEGVNLTQLATSLHEKIKQQFNIDRPIIQIQEYLTTMAKPKQQQQHSDKKPIQEVSVSLFKTFQDEGKNSQNFTLARPIPNRKTPINFISNRKIPKKQPIQHRLNSTLQQRLDELEQINQQCNYTYDKYDKKSNRKTSVKELNGVNNSILWFYNEFFYSNYDKKYFDTNPMREIYSTIEYKVGEVTYKMHKNLIRSLPTPKLFNDEFILNEKNKLEDFRNICRQNNTKNLSKNNESTTDFPVHSIVLALHPLCGHLHTGSIMAYYKQNLYMVRFLKPELPAQKILDINMSTQFTAFSNKSLNRNNANLQSNANQSLSQQNQTYEIVQHINFQMTGYLIKILAFKSQLVKLIRNINDKSDKKQNVAPERKDINLNKQIFQWAVGICKKLDEIIQQALLRFRLRGVNQENSSTIYGNLRSLLLNPLKLMSKQFQNSNEQPDINAAQQIRHIINKQRENQIKKAISNAIMIINNNNLKSQVQPQSIHDNGNKQNIKTQNGMINLIHSCLSILADLRFEGKSFDVQNNPNLIKLADICGQDNYEAFNQVYERLYSIVNKVKE